MVKKYSIVEFSDGVQVIPSCWMDVDKTKCTWPGHIKSSYKLNKIIIEAKDPSTDVGTQWETCTIDKWFGATDTYERAVELRDKAMDTSTIFDSEATVSNEEEHRSQMKERRRKHARVQVPSAELSASEEAEPPLKKQKKQKNKQNEFPNIPSQIHLQEDLNAQYVASEPQRSPEPSILAVETRKSPDPAVVAAGSAQQGIAEGQSNYHAFMRHKIAFICKMLDSMNDRLEKIEQIRTHADMTVCVRDNNSDPDLERIHNILPVEDEENLKKLEGMLQNVSVLNSMIGLLKRSSGKNVAMTTSSILTEILGTGLAMEYSWHGKKTKKSFKSFVNVHKLVLRSVHAACIDRGHTCCDEHIISAGAKWLAQAKTRATRLSQSGKETNDNIPLIVDSPPDLPQT